MNSRGAWLPILAIVLLWGATIVAGDRARHAPNLPIESAAKAESSDRTCPFDFQISTLDYLTRGTNCGTGNDTEDYGPCAPGISYPGPDQLYAVEVSRFAHFGEVTLTAPTADLGIFLLTGCEDLSSCSDASDYYYPGTVEVVSFPVAAGSREPFYLYVDSYYASGPLSCGDYKLEISALPVELIRFTVE